MSEEKILTKLRSSNEHLNNIAKQYLLSYLEQPILGYQSFYDIKRGIHYGLNEYRKTYSNLLIFDASLSIAERRAIRSKGKNDFDEYSLDTLNKYEIDYSNWTITRNCKLFSITKEEHRQFKASVNDILASYTDELLSNEKKRNILSNQIKSIACGSEDNTLKKICKKLLKDEEYDRHTYINSVLAILNKTHLNQIDNNKYIVIGRLFDTYISFLNHLDTYNFREKKKYLQKLKHKKETHKIPDLLAEYFKNIYDQEHTEEASLESIQWFYFYLVHGKAKLITYLMDSILGDKYKSTQALVQKLFLLDHTSGQSTDNFNFSHHDWISKIHTVDYAEENKYNPLYKEILKEL